MKRLNAFALSFATMALVACGQSGETPKTDLGGDLQTFSDLLEKPFSQAGASEADLSRLVAALPDYASLTWDAKRLDASNGATVFEGLKIGFGDAPQVGIAFEEASVWGLETELLAARLQGERLEETGVIFTRLDADNMTYFGIAEAGNRGIDFLLSRMGEELPPEIDFSIDGFESVTERVVVTDLALRPWELSLVDAAKLDQLDEEAQGPALEALHVAQKIIAIVRSASYGASIAEGTQGRFAMTQPGSTASVDMIIDFAAYEGASGFDLDYSITKGAKTTQTSTYSSIDMDDEDIMFSPFPDGFTLKQEDTTLETSVRNLKLDNMFGYFARGELPGMEVRDLMSLGVWEAKEFSTKINDKDVFSGKRMTAKLDEFEWVIPSDMDIAIEGGLLNTSEIVEFFSVAIEAGMRSTGPLDDEEAQAEFDLVMEGISKALDLMPEYGLDKLPFDLNFSATWNADQGSTDFSWNLDAEGYGQNLIDLNITLPTYAAALAAYQSDDPEAAFEAAFEKSFAFRGLRYSDTDKGSIDKLFSFANAIGKEFESEGWGAMLGNMEPAQMRTYLATTVRMGGMQAAAEFPQAADWIEAYAKFLESGGTFAIVSTPPKPITAELIESYEDEPSPEEMMKIFGLEITHTK